MVALSPSRMGQTGQNSKVAQAYSHLTTTQNHFIELVIIFNTFLIHNIIGERPSLLILLT